MITVKKISIVLLTILASNSCLVARYNPFEQMRKHFEEMEKAFDETFSNITLKSDSTAAMQLTIDEDAKNKVVKVKITNVDTEKIDTEVNRNGNKLTIKTDNGSMVMHVKQNYMSVTMEVIQEQTGKDEKGKESPFAKASEDRAKDDATAERSDQNHFISSSYFSSSHGQTLGHRVDLKNPTIDYTKDTKTLTISIPYAQTEEEGSTKIPVNIK